MKTICVICEGVADVHLPELEGRTPLETARCTHANRLAEVGRCGLLVPVQEGVDARNEVMVALLCGLSVTDAHQLYRGPLEALSLGIGARGDFVYRGNFVTVDGDVLTDSLLGSLSQEETTSLARTLRENMARDGVHIEAAGPGRVVVVVPGGDAAWAAGLPPGLMEGERYDAFLPGGKEGEFIRRIAETARDVLPGHQVNDVRVDLGENPANGLFLWGGGPGFGAGAFARAHRSSGVFMGASCWFAGLAKACGAPLIHLKSPWVEPLDQPTFKVAALVEALREHDHLTIHVDSPVELGRYGTAEDKVRALERVDHYLLAPLLSVLDACRPYRLVLTSDGVVSSAAQHPTSGNVPLVLVGDGVEGDEAHRWDEQACGLGALGAIKPSDALAHLVGEA